jgi:hypothetical protein
LTRHPPALTLIRMSKIITARRPSASAPFTPPDGPGTAIERVLRSLELGRRGQLLRKRGEHARSGRDTRAR